MKEFTFYWLTGKRQVFKGADPADALNRAGFSGGSTRALDFYADGDNKEYEWVNHNWERKTLDKA